MSSNKTETVTEALSSMPPALKQCYKRISTLLSDVNRGNILARHETGKIVGEVLNSEDNKFGNNAAEKLSTALDMPKQELYRCKVFSETFTEKQARTIADRKTAGGRKITWSHLDAIIRIPKPDVREKLLEKVFNEDLQVRALNDIIKQKLGKRGAGKGRPRATPKTPEGALALLEKQAKSVVGVFETAVPKLDEVIGSPAEFMEFDLATLVDDVTPQIKAAIEAFNVVLDRCESVKAALDKSKRAKKNRNEFAAESQTKPIVAVVKKPKPKAEAAAPTRKLTFKITQKKPLQLPDRKLAKVS